MDKIKKSLLWLKSRLLWIISASIALIKHRLFAFTVGVCILYLLGLLLKNTTDASEWFFIVLLAGVSFVVSPRKSFNYLKFLITGKE